MGRKLCLYLKKQRHFDVDIMQPAIEKGHKVDIFPNRTSINGIMRDET